MRVREPAVKGGGGESAHELRVVKISQAALFVKREWTVVAYSLSRSPAQGTHPYPKEKAEPTVL